VVAACLGLALGPSMAATKGETAALIAALKAIPAANGGSVYARLSACGIRLETETSYAELAHFDMPEFDAIKGDLIVDILMDFPPLPGDEADARRGKYHDIHALWIVRDGVPRPQSGWAGSLQNKPSPLGSPSWLDC